MLFCRGFPYGQTVSAHRDTGDRRPPRCSCTSPTVTRVPTLGPPVGPGQAGARHPELCASPRRGGRDRTEPPPRAAPRLPAPGALLPAAGTAEPSPSPPPAPSGRAGPGRQLPPPSRTEPRPRRAQRGRGRPWPPGGERRRQVPPAHRARAPTGGSTYRCAVPAGAAAPQRRPGGGSARSIPGPGPPPVPLPERPDRAPSLPPPNVK